MLMIARRAITGCVKPYEDGFLIRLTFLALSGLRVRRDSGLSMRGRLARGGRTRGRRKGDQRMAVAQDGDDRSRWAQDAIRGASFASPSPAVAIQ
jgi:hypothetical protein